MIIEKVNITKFRGFENVQFSLGEYVTLIAGQNGTQKSTLLGILTQTFTIPNAGHPFSNEVPLTGGTYRSAFQDKFRLSPNLDLPGEHDWTLYFKDRSIHSDIDEDGGFSVESIARSSQGNETVRFWQKGNRSAGSGYVQLPVIFLSLKRLIPIAESGRLKSTNIELTNKEVEWYSKIYNKVLISNDNITSVDYLENRNKNTLGASTDYYDWNSNSAGQDNLGRILLAIISFQRLKENFPDDYKGGILAIDEIDATLYPASQVELLNIFSSICKKNNIQIIATTHSLHLLERAAELKNERNRSDQFNTIYLKKVDGMVEAEESPEFSRIIHNLNASMGKKKPIKKKVIFTEDKECTHFLKAILGRKFKNLDFSDTSLGCENLLDLARKKVEIFTFPNSIVVLDGDARNSLSKARLKNFMCLPGDLSPERMIAQFLNDLSDTSDFWEEKNEGYSKQVCFRNYSLEEVMAPKSRKIAKDWYNEQLDSNAWGRQASTVYKYLFKTIEDDVQQFIDDFNNLYNMIK